MYEIRPRRGQAGSATFATGCKGRRGPKKAIVAVAASMLTAAYFMLRDEKDYHDLGGRYLADRDKHRVTQHLIRRLQSLGVEVEVKVA